MQKAFSNRWRVFVQSSASIPQEQAQSPVLVQGKRAPPNPLQAYRAGPVRAECAHRDRYAMHAKLREELISDLQRLRDEFARRLPAIAAGGGENFHIAR